MKVGLGDHLAMSPPSNIFECLLETSSPEEGVAPFTRAITDLTSTFPQKRKNGGTPVGYLGRAASRREQCDMRADSWNN
jgi:hypothetical protein